MMVMLWLTRIVIVVLVLLIGVALYRAFYQACALFFRIYRSRCPRCGKRGLKIIGGYLATVMVDGKRAPDSSTDYACDKCGAVMRWHRGEWKEVPEADISAIRSGLR
jgi:predicted RNA-binding Zn-ribbon protein involved in translation (DUF1610 family)